MARKKSKKGLVIFSLSVLGVIGVLAGASAIITKGFTRSFKDGITGTEAVMTLKADSMEEGIVTFTNGSEEEEVTLQVTVQGSLAVDEEHEEIKTLTLGDKESSSNISRSELESDLASKNFSARAIENIESEVLGLGYAKGSSLSFTINVESDEDAVTSAYTEVAYFDAIRINYKADSSRLVVQSNANESKQTCSYDKKNFVSKTLSEDIKLLSPEEDMTLSENGITFTVFSIGNEKDNRVVIESIQLLRTSRSHAGESCWFVQ